MMASFGQTHGVRLGIPSQVSRVFGRWPDCPGLMTDGKVSNNSPKMTDFESQIDRPDAPSPVNRTVPA